MKLLTDMPSSYLPTGMPDIIEKDGKYVWHPFTSLTSSPPLPVSKAEGVWLHTNDGRKILDAVSSWWVNLYGHGRREIADAIAKQAREMEHVIFAGFTHEPAVSLAEKIINLAGGTFQKVFFSDNGSTSVEVALKLAIQFWSNKNMAKSRIVALEGAYHGDTFGAMSAGERNIFNQPFNPYLFNVEFLPFPEENFEEEVVCKFEELCRSGEVAAFIFEPLIQGTAGMRIYSPEVLETLLQVARKYEVVSIADEVFTCMGRTGKKLASDYMKSKPDIICISKGITGGFLPLGLTVCNERVVNAFMDESVNKTFYHGHSYTANAIACAAANASVDLLYTIEMQSNIERIAKKHSAFVNRVAEHNRVGKVKSLGTILSIELETGMKTGYTNNLRKFLYDYFIKKDILLRPLGNVIYMVPPYIIKDEELDMVYSAIQDLLENLP